MVAVISVQNQISSRNKKEFTKVSRAVGKAKCQNTDKPLEFGKACEGLSERAERRIKGGTSASGVAIRLGRKIVGGFQGCCCYLRNVQDFFFGMGRHHLKGDVENHSVSP